MSQNVPYDLDLFRDEFAAYSGTAKGLKGFSLRDDDKTGSCYVSKKSRFYLFTDFGANNITPDGKGINAIDYVMKTRFVDFNAACALLFAQFNLPVRTIDQLKPITEFSAKVTENEGFWDVEYFEQIQDEKAFKRIIPFYTEKLLLEYDFAQVAKYEVVGKGSKGLYHMTTTATPEFPIYGYNKKDFAKLYQPFAPKNDKFLHKHSFVGTKPERPIYGWDRLFSLVDEDKIDTILKQLKSAKGTTKATLLDELASEQLDEVIIATGGTDGMNIASLNYHVIWFNSETEVISKTEYKRLAKIAKVIYYCPDLDKTGVKQAVTMGMKLPKIKMIWLPESLKTQGKKDIADWVRMNKGLGLEFVKNLFKQILSQSVEFQFWKWNAKRGAYSLGINQMLQFLKYNGFFQYKLENNSADNTKKIEDKMFIKVQNNIATQVFPADIKAFVLNWLKQNFISIEVQEMLIKSVFFSERSGLNSLELIELQTKTGAKESQVYFFNNQAVTIKKDTIKVVKLDTIDTVTWQGNIVKRDFKLQETAPFKIFTNDKGELDIEITNPASNYFKVLINTSRVFWRNDINDLHQDTNNFNITSNNMIDLENQMQKMQLINKIFCIGHLLHKYKMKSKSYLVLGIDRKVSDDSTENNGGSGKSFIIENVFNYVFNRSIIDGRNLQKDDQKFMLDGVTKETDLVYFEDLSAYYDFNSFFNYVTGEIKANHKGGKIFTIPFADFAKPIVTMNAVPHDITASLNRRLVVFECGDYYHEIGLGYNETRTIRSDFKKDLFDENYTAAEWANDDNFMMYALQYYLNCDTKVEIEGSNLEVRNKIQKIGKEQMKFFNSFFKKDMKDWGHIGSRDRVLWIYKKGIHDFYKEEVGSKALAPGKFKDALNLYVDVKKWEIVWDDKKIGGTGTGVVDHFRLNMNPDENALQVNEDAKPNDIIDEEEPQTDLPF
jgi:hypothetical protein